MTGPPVVVVVAGPNGAGKSTVAPSLLSALGIAEFVNADDIASGLSALTREGASIAAGRVMLGRIKTLATARATFAFETTLASRSFAPWLNRLKNDGYAVHVIFLWLPSVETAIARVADRVARGGHSIPTATIQRRYRRGVRNFFELYVPLVSTWRMYDSSDLALVLIAEGLPDGTQKVYAEDRWRLARQTATDTDHEA